jgi:HAD superfamily hydrolase (TIGR01484 family)
MTAARLPIDQPIELFLVDVDNTLSNGGGLPFNLNLLLEVQALSARSRKDRVVPPIALITGRPQPYLEAVQQAVASPVPGVFEFGYGVYDLIRERSATNPAWTPAMAEVREQLIASCEEEFVAARKGRIRYGNTTSVTIIPTAPNTMESLHYPSFKVSREFSDTYTLHTGPTTIDFVPRDIHKGIGVLWLAEVLKVPVARVAAIGSSSTDLPMFREAAVSFAPLNAIPPVKAEATVVARGSHTGGVIEAYHALIAHNESL